jgi:hypothetical protein
VWPTLSSLTALKSLNLLGRNNNVSQEGDYGAAAAACTSWTSSRSPVLQRSQCDSLHLQVRAEATVRCAELLSA